MPETPKQRAEREAANTAAGVPQNVLNECPRWDVRLAELTVNNQDYAVDYEWTFDHIDENKLVLRRTVWTKAYRRKDQHIAWQGDAAVVFRYQVPGFVRDLVSCVST